MKKMLTEFGINFAGTVQLFTCRALYSACLKIVHYLILVFASRGQHGHKIVDL